MLNVPQTLPNGFEPASALAPPRPAPANPAAHFGPELERTIKRSLWVVGGLTLTIATLAATLPMTGAVIATGAVSVESSVKKIGHPFGGVVADILVKDGDTVAANQVLLRLDTTVSESNSDLSGQSLDQLLALEARLIAERDSRGAIAFPAALTSRQDDPNVRAIIANEQRNFEVRRSANAAEKAQLAQRIQQAQADISAYRGQASSFAKQSELIDQELGMTRELYEKRYTTLERLNALERSAVGIDSSRQTASANIAQATARIREMQAQAGSVDAMARSQAAAQLIDVQAALASSRQQKVAADDTFERGVIRAPQAGVVDKLTVKTIGAVLPAGQDILEIVPSGEAMTVDARIAPEDVDQVAEEQKATLHFSGLNRQTTPELEGVLTFLSPTQSKDETGASFYRATISFTPQEAEKLGPVTLRVGMPVEVFVQTTNRTMLSFWTRPLADQWRRAFRSH